MSEENKEIQGSGFGNLMQSKSSEEILRLEFLQRRYDIIQAIENYERFKLQGYEASRQRQLVIVRIATLFRELRPLLMRKHPQFAQLEKECRSLKGGKIDFLEFSDKLLLFMDQEGITKIDVYEKAHKKRLED